MEIGEALALGTLLLISSGLGLMSYYYNYDDRGSGTEKTLEGMSGWSSIGGFIIGLGFLVYGISKLFG